MTVFRALKMRYFFFIVLPYVVCDVVAVVSSIVFAFSSAFVRNDSCTLPYFLLLIVPSLFCNAVS